jgi:hypothetical protein
MAETVKTDMREWNRSFERYVAVRKTARKDIIAQKARDFAFKVYQSLAPTDQGRITKELTHNKLILKLTVKRLKKKGVQLKGLGGVKPRTVRGGSGGGRAISAVDKLISSYANKLLRARQRSSGYHRAAFLILAQKLGESGGASVNSRSILAKTDISEQHTATGDTYTLNARARGLDCPSTHAARDKALALIKAAAKKPSARRWKRRLKPRSGINSTGPSVRFVARRLFVYLVSLPKISAGTSFPARLLCEE